jgi:hypothetical protein
MKSVLRLLPENDLIRTNDLDKESWNFRSGVLGFVQRRRFTMAVSLLDSGYESLFDLGYGSGPLLPELARHCRKLSGADSHSRANEVGEVLRAYGRTSTW